MAGLGCSVRCFHSHRRFATLFFFLYCVALSRSECVRENACSCRDQQTSQLVSLYSLANRQGQPGLHVQDGNFVYEFNPCINITSPICEDVAFCQHFNNSKPGEFASLGTQSSVQFAGTVADNNVRMQLQGRTNHGGEATTRFATVNLICDRSATTPSFVFVKEQPSDTYTFNLTTLCACPGVCPPPPEECTTNEFDKCSCQLSDGGGSVNLRGLDDPSSPIVSPSILPQFNVTAYYNPCSGMTGGPPPCVGSTVCVQFMNEFIKVGEPSTESYSVDPDGNVIVSYSGDGGSRSAKMKLICDYTARHLPALHLVNPIPLPQLQLELRSICACPGGCISPPLSCQPIDDCSCKISQGGGTVSLHQLDNPNAPLTYHRVISPQGQTFVYNPCSNFSIAGVGDDCRDVAGCQFDGYAGADYPNHAMGIQNTAQFRISQDGVVTVSYTQGQTGRHFGVELICNKEAVVPQLTWVSENPQHFYHLQLESEYSCPAA